MEKLDTGTWEVGGSQAPEATTGKGRMTSLGAPEPGPDVPPHMEGGERPLSPGETRST